MKIDKNKIYNFDKDRIEKWKKLYSNFLAYSKLPAAGEGIVKFSATIADTKELITYYIQQKISGETMLAELSTAIGDTEAFNFIWELREYIDLVENLFNQTQSIVWKAIDDGFVPTTEKFNNCNFPVNSFILIR